MCKSIVTIVTTESVPALTSTSVSLERQHCGLFAHAAVAVKDTEKGEPVWWWASIHGTFGVFSVALRPQRPYKGLLGTGSPSYSLSLICQPDIRGIDIKPHIIMIREPQSSGAVWKSRWPSWAPVPNTPTVSVDVKQHFSNNGKPRTATSTFTDSAPELWHGTGVPGANNDQCDQQNPWLTEGELGELETFVLQGLWFRFCQG